MVSARARMMLILALALSPSGCVKKDDAVDRSGTRPVTMEVVVVDDDFDPFTEPVGALPDGVSIRLETAIRARGLVTQHYAMLVKKPGETDAQAKERFSPWLSAQPLPAGRRFIVGDVVEENETGELSPIGLRTYVLTGEAIVTQANVIDASVLVDDGKGPMRQPVVMVTFDAAGGERFHEATREHVKERIAIVVDGKAMSLPVVQSPIPGGRVSISMQGYDEQAVAEAQRLAAGLRGKAK
ncbi:SecDF P1 head subdomain-containing protein [Polyangium jinanense]|uniref:SecDF P1 head subdomain domain-containing protein n=1 Tax=Polyangium jinanense TaxID=2829994 RepID=A0A9X4ARF2_9BACT|nr:hypothetical protein [Polyangium jinanense]MDC3954848.1 hypothetical protein [Polyangium jinanense]MDC3981381.1 hypothetical protein [Polyangium jinanense]